jgi:hypothetical protein
MEQCNLLKNDGSETPRTVSRRKARPAELILASFQQSAHTFFCESARAPTACPFSLRAPALPHQLPPDGWAQVWRRLGERSDGATQAGWGQAGEPGQRRVPLAVAARLVVAWRRRDRSRWRGGGAGCRWWRDGGSAWR